MSVKRMRKETREYLETLNSQIRTQRMLIEFRSSTIHNEENAEALKKLEEELNTLKHYREEFIITARNFNVY